MSKETGQKKKPGEGEKKETSPVEQIEKDALAGEIIPDPDEAPEALDPEVVLEDGDVDAAQLEERAGELLGENAELLDNLIRLKADFENYRKRMLREQTRILETAESGLVKKLLPVIDNLERALGNSAGSEKTDGMRQGVSMVLDQLMEILKKEGLEVIDPEGQPFDPEHHEAMMVIETDECPEDTVVEVTQKGYKFGGMLLRPAMVKVSCAVKSNDA